MHCKSLVAGTEVVIEIISVKVGMGEVSPRSFLAPKKIRKLGENCGKNIKKIAKITLKYLISEKTEKIFLLN